MNWTWLISVLAVVGVVLNIKKKRCSFAIWSVTNAAWAVVDFRSGLPAQGALFTVYFFLSVWGLLEWRK